MSDDVASASAPLATGELLLGRYRIGELLAEGGHSLVYRAEDERLHRPACVKILRVASQDPNFQQAVEQHFVQEAYLLARLTHPTTIRIFDFGYRTVSDVDVPFQVNELVTGGPLSRWVKRRGRLEAGEVLPVVLPLCHALSEVHAAGLLHLDIKPQNILMSRGMARREPRLADFGIARTIVDARADAGARSSVLMYSPNWAAPEQMVGDAVGVACDVYSLALLTVYALTGKLVFHESEPVQAYRLRKYGHDIVGNMLDERQLPGELTELLLRACSFDPAHRFDDIIEFGRRLQAAGGSLTPASPSLSIEDSSPTGVDGRGDRSLPGRVTAAQLWSLSIDLPCPEIAGRRLSFVRAEPEADLVPDERVRLRVSFLPSAERKLRLHIKGLNCFVSIRGRRPSSGITLDGSASLEFLSARGERLGEAEASFATEGLTRSVVTVAGQSLVVPTEQCGHLVALDFGPSRPSALVYERRLH